MKKITLIIICAFLLSLQIVKAQPYSARPQAEREKAAANYLNACPVIFEGKFYPESGKSFYHTLIDGSKVIYTTYTVNVTHVYKGSFKPCDVKVVVFGGRILRPDGTYDSLQGDGGTFSDGIKIFCTKVSNKINLDDYHSLTFELFCKDNMGGAFTTADMEDTTIKYAGPFGLYFKNWQEVQNYLSTFKNLKMSSTYQKKSFGNNLNNGLGFKTPKAMTITSNFTGIVKNAGIGDTLTIIGTGFGSMKGKVKFKDADNNDLNNNHFYTRGCDSIDIVEWKTDGTRIKILVWSYILNGYNPNTSSGCAGSGFVRVINNTKTDSITSNTAITVRYSVLNVSNWEGTTLETTQATRKINMYLANQKCRAGFIFTLHTSLVGQNDVINAIEAAIL